MIAVHVLGAGTIGNVVTVVDAESVVDTEPAVPAAGPAPGSVAWRGGDARIARDDPIG